MRRLTTIFAGLAAVLALAAWPVAASAGTSAASHSQRELASPKPNCVVPGVAKDHGGTAKPDVCGVPTDNYYDFSNSSTLCFQAGPSPSSVNWSSEGCRNVDEYFADELPDSDAIRLYYSPNEDGAWVCVPNGFGATNSGNLSGYTFNNGPGDAGYGQSIENNVASSKVADGNNCSNPI